jgi:hypothetical protein
MTKEEALKYVKATIKTGNAKRIKEVMAHYLKAFPDKVDETYETAKKLFE